MVEGVELPPYYDPQYSCEMEMLRFESCSPNPKYEGWIEEIRAHLLTAPVILRRGRSIKRRRTLESVLLTRGERTGLPQ